MPQGRRVGRTRARRRAATTRRARSESDIFICKRATTGEYWAFPSPFVAHGHGAEIQFSNLTDDDITIEFGSAFRRGKPLTIKKRTKQVVTVSNRAPSGLHEYVATVSKKHRVDPLGRRMPILVRGGSPPEIIIDT